MADLLEQTLAEEEERLRQEALAWVEITTHPRYEQTIGRRVKELLGEANRAVLDWRRESRERDVATGKFEAWSEALSWPERFAAIVANFHEQDVAEFQSKQQQEREDPDAYPGPGEAWFEKND